MIDIDGIKMYTSKELAELTGVSLPTITKWRRKGLITSVWIGKKKYTSEQSLRDFLTGRTSGKLVNK